MRTTRELEEIAEKAILGMPQDLMPSELGYVISVMIKGHAIALKKRGS